MVRMQDTEQIFIRYIVMPRCAKANIEDYSGSERMVPGWLLRVVYKRKRKLLKIATITNCWANNNASFFWTTPTNIPTFAQLLPVLSKRWSLRALQSPLNHSDKYENPN